ncbi:SAM-dependent methyltransferase [Nocardiopsis sp. SBT366]|uniref:SAM-dependent methyltransferase n=1 Tax=Nocardiopsis sp. SBT366 TaxID=1580529 RepID=UPI0009E264D5|nr:SAM-dependent methyltransferase [Nocardiopsis sp. SBT366]
MSVGRHYFDSMYAGATDPWGFRSRWYEARKRALTIASLPRQRYARAFEPGCAIGALTKALSERCDEVLAWEVVPEAASLARRDLTGADHVEVVHAAVPEEWPGGDFDLVVLSELLYYFDDTDLATVFARTARSLTGDGTVVAVHWRHPVDDHVRSGDDVHRALDAVPGLDRTVLHVERDFMLAVYERSDTRGPRSVAEREGLA